MTVPVVAVFIATLFSLTATSACRRANDAGGIITGSPADERDDGLSDSERAKQGRKEVAPEPLNRSNHDDVCPESFDPQQEDRDKDGLRDGCPDKASAGSDDGKDEELTESDVTESARQSDTDRDGISNYNDICPAVFDPLQEDRDRAEECLCLKPTILGTLTS